MAENVTNLPSSSDADEAKLPTKKKLKELMSAHNTMKANMDSIRGELGAKLKDAETTNNIHRGAFKLAAKLDRMDPEHRSAFLLHLDHYRAELELDRDGALFGDAA